MARRNTNRRQFLREGALAGVGFWAAGGVVLGDEAKKLANDKINIACIGVGGKGDSDTNDAGQVGNIVALCDIDDNTLNKKAEKFPKAKKYNDFRKMLEEMEKDIDAVTVSTPDHTHAPAAMMAMKMKKHVYCQKPLTHTVYEARQMRETAKKMGVATQMGNQGTASDGVRRAAEIIQAGAIGKVSEVHVWTNRPVWDQAPDYKARPKEAPVPAHVHWDLFLGPAPERPYSPVYHPFSWRGWLDFGTGALGDMACHTANMAFLALKLGHPTSVVAEAGDVNPETYPTWAKVTFNFPARGEMPALKFYWYEGREGGRHNKNGKRTLPPEELLGKVLKPGQTLADSGSILVGDKGILFSPNDYGEQYKLLPEKDFADYKGPEKTLPRNGGGDLGMKKEWAEAMRGSKPAMSNFDYAAMLTETILLGNVAVRAGGKLLEWDGPELKFTNDKDANKFLHYEYRKGWTL